MTNATFKEIRLRLGLSPAELAAVLCYPHVMQVYELERATNPKPVPRHVAMLMKAYDDGYRPEGWPK